MVSPPLFGESGGAGFLVVVLVYLLLSVLYLLFPLLLVSFLREGRGPPDRLVRGRFGGRVRDRLAGLVRGRLGELVRPRRPSGVDSRDR